MNMRGLTRAFFLLLLGASSAHAQNASAPEEKAIETRYALAVIDDATFYSDQPRTLPTVLNRVLVEPSFGIRLRNRYTFSSSLIGDTTTHYDTSTQLLVRETYAAVSAGDLDVLAGRKLVRWGTGYAFTAAGVLDPPRIPTDPSDRLNLNEGRDMLKADLVHGTHAFTLAWSTAELARHGSSMRDTTAFRYNVLVLGFDSALIAGNDRGGDSFGGLTFTRVIGQAWETHGEFLWREHPAILIGGKYTMHNGATFIGEYYTPPNTPYYRDRGVSPFDGRQNYLFFDIMKSRLRDRPRWKEWDVSGAFVSNLNDHSIAGVLDVSRWAGKHFSAYAHVELPAGSKRSQYGSVPYTAATSLGVRFHL
jgi:hypothetical protein